MPAALSRRLVAITVAVLSLSAARVLTGQTPQSEDYDITRKVAIKGMLVGGAAPAPPHSVYLLVTATDAKGNEQHWAVEGDSANRLRERGYRDDALTMGGIITVTGYAPRAGRRPERRMPQPPRRAMERASDLAKEGRLILGVEITLADGTKIPFGRIE